MRKTSLIVLCTMFTVDAFAGAGGNIGILDDRKYGSLENPLYLSIGRFKTGRGGSCTSGFIAPNVVLTNRHCASSCEPVTKCNVTFWNGTKYVETKITEILAIGKGSDVYDGMDWAILKTDIPNTNFKDVAPKSTVGAVIRGGFGDLRVIENNEVRPLKEIFNQTYNKYKNECHKESDSNACIWRHFNDAAKAAGFKPLTGDSRNLKVQNCKITGNHPQSSKMLATTCDSSGGDSGAPLLRGNDVVGLNNSGPHSFFSGSESNGATAVKTENFYHDVQRAISNLGKISTNNDNKPPKQNQQPLRPAQNNNEQPQKPNTNNIGGTVPSNNNTPGVIPEIPNTEPVNNNPTPANQPLGNVITDPEQIRKIFNEEIMQLECD